jgi:hypothetical protein
MWSSHSVLAAVILATGALAPADDPTAPTPEQRAFLENRNIDMPAHLRLAMAAAKRRESHLATEEEFLRMSREPGTLILDARSQRRFDQLHVKGAVNLSFPDLAVESLKKLIPDKATRILIYCNNNFLNAPDAFPTKLPPASLNLSTYTTLYIYGYRNVYELGPTVDIKESKLEFEKTPGEAPR